MDNTELAMKIRLHAWMQNQHEYAASNMGGTERCAYKHISRNTFFYRQRKLREAAANAVSVNEDALHKSRETSEDFPDGSCRATR